MVMYVPEAARPVQNRNTERERERERKVILKAREGGRDLPSQAFYT
jgi:hypothetical protein